MQLIRHTSARKSQYVTEWRLADAVFTVQWRLPGQIQHIQLSAYNPEKRASVTLAPAEQITVALVYGQLLLAAGTHLSLGDELQEFIVMERMALERRLLDTSSWHDGRPSNDSAITRIGSRA